MNTMAERDLGSTVLLPHTHLYKPSTDRVRNFVKQIVEKSINSRHFREVTFQDSIHFSEINTHMTNHHTTKH